MNTEYYLNLSIVKEYESSRRRKVVVKDGDPLV
jgi:hypothetical protein